MVEEHALPMEGRARVILGEFSARRSCTSYS